MKIIITEEFKTEDDCVLYKGDICTVLREYKKFYYVERNISGFPFKHEIPKTHCKVFKEKNVMFHLNMGRYGRYASLNKKTVKVLVSQEYENLYEVMELLEETLQEDYEKYFNLQGIEEDKLFTFIVTRGKTVFVNFYLSVDYCRHCGINVEVSYNFDDVERLSKQPLDII